MSEPPSKSKKLAAARKRLKEYQSQRKEQHETSTDINDQPATSENVSFIPLEKQSSEISINISDDSNDNGETESTSKLPVTSYFSHGKTATADTFFDNLLPVHSSNIKNETKSETKPMEPFLNVIHAEVENGAVVSDELIHDTNSDKAESVSSTVDSSSDYTQKLSYSITAQDSIEQPSCSDISELERKNEELISTLVLEQKKYDDLFHHLSNYKQEMEGMVDSLKNQNFRLQSELCEMESTVKMHLAALDMITSEKNAAENEKSILNTELIELRKQVDHLQSEINNAKDLQGNYLVLENKYKELVENEQCSRQSTEILEEMNSELTKKLELKSAELEKFIHMVDANQSTISMLQMQINQMGGNVDMESINNQHKNLQEELLRYQEAVRELKDKVQSLVFERDQNRLNHKNYIHSLEEATNSQLRIQGLTNENMALQNSLSTKIEHIAKLEKQLQRNVQEQNKTDNSILGSESEKDALIKKLQEDIQLMNETLHEKANKEEFLERKLLSLENAIDQYESEKGNIERLQNSIESEKVAASQAILQNNKLKTQYEELHDAFITLNNNKIELLERIEQEKDISQRLSKQLAKQSSENFSSPKLQTSEIGTNTSENLTDEDSQRGNKMNINAMVQLQEKFKDVVHKMADLTDEKQQLEHLVTQLQSETETIGEYVALYQKQRFHLNQKSQDKDQLICQVMREKDELYRKVMHLSALLQSVSPNDVDQTISNINADDYKSIETTSTRMNSDGVLHPTCCYCSGRRIITV